MPRDDIYKKLKKAQAKPGIKQASGSSGGSKSLSVKKQESVAKSLVNPKKKKQLAKYNLKKAAKPKKTFRHELKFYINNKECMMLLSQMSALLAPDKHSINGGYNIRSLYFDDNKNSAVWEKLSGVAHRTKYRIRIYEFSDEFIRIEKKVKRGEYVSKISLPISKEEYYAIIDGNYDFLPYIEHPLAREFYLEMKNSGLKPCAIVDYYRQAYTYPVEDVRITFDLDLRSGYFKGDIFDSNIITLPMLDKGMSVLEVKFNRFLPDFIKGVLNNASSPLRSSISKYTICRTYD